MCAGGGSVPYFTYIIFNALFTRLLIVAFVALIVALAVLYIVVVVGVEVEIRHQVGLHIVDRLGQRLQELVEILLVKEDLVPVVAILIKFLPAFSDGKIVIITTSCPHIEEIRPALASPDPFAVDAFHSFVVVFVRHNKFFSVVNFQLSSHKYRIVFELAKFATIIVTPI